MPEHPAIDGALDVVHHAAGEGEDLRPQVSLDDFLDRGSIARRHHRHARFNAMNTGFGQRFGDPDLVVFREDDAGLLFAVAQRDVVKLDLLREMELIAHRALKVPRANEPLICLPRFLRHDEFLQTTENLDCLSGLQRFRIHWISRRLPAQHADHLFGGLGLQIDQRFFGIETGMGRDDHVIASKKPRSGWRLLFHHIQSRSRQVALIQRVGKCRFIDDRARAPY